METLPINLLLNTLVKIMKLGKTPNIISKITYI